MKPLGLVFFLYFCRAEAEADGSTAAVQNSIDALLSIRSNPLWKTRIEPVRIIMDGRAVTLGEFPNSPTPAAVAADDESAEFAFRLSKAMYTALKCKYSDLLVTTFFDLFDCVTLCDILTPNTPFEDGDSDFEAKLWHNKEKCLAHVTEQLIRYKDYVARMIFNLMHFMTISPNLKSTDHTLVKCLISLNLFLYDLKAKFEKYKSGGNADYASDVNSEVDVKKAIVKMINLIEIFNCKYCYVQNANYFHFNTPMNRDIVEIEDLYRVVDRVILANIKDFKTLLLNSMSLEKILKSTVPQLNVAMYDPEYLLLGDVFSELKKTHPFFADLKVTWNDDGEWRELKRVYEEVARSGDVKAVFDYQVLLFEVIKDVFYAKFVKAYGDGDDGDEEAEDVAEAFFRFVDGTLPRNYPTRYRGPIAEVRNALFYDQRVTALMLERTVVNTWGESNAAAAELDGANVDRLVARITALEPWDGFVRAFELFSYESNVLGDYRLQPAAAAAANVDGDTCERLAGLRDVLVAFHVLIDGARLAAADNAAAPVRRLVEHDSLDAAIRAVRENVESFRRAYANDGSLDRILSPLSSRVSSMGNAPNAIGAERQLWVAWRAVRLALNQLERHAIDGCSSPRFNRDAYRDVTGDASLYLPRDGDSTLLSLFFQYRAQLSAEVRDRAARHKLAGRGWDDAVFRATGGVDRLVPDPSALHGREIDRDGPTSCRLLWDGSYVTVDRAYADVASRDVAVDHQCLIRFQMFEIKWTVSRAFKTLLFVALRNDEAAAKGRGGVLKTVEDDARRFKDLPFPESVRTYVRGILDLFLVALTTRDERITNLFRSEVLRQLAALSVSSADLTTSGSELNEFSISKLCALFHADVDHLKRFLTLIEDISLIDNLEFSSALY